MIAYTGIETVSNLAEEARDPPRDIPRSISWVAIAVFAIYFTLVTLVFFGQDRFRVPILPWMVMEASAFILAPRVVAPTAERMA